MDRKEQKRQWYLKNKEKMKEYREENKEKAKEYQKEYREKHEEKAKEYQKEYHEKHKEKIKEYYQTEQGKKISRINNWKRRGIIFHDFDLLYKMYIETTHCDECKCELTTGRYITNTTKCVDHDHSITDDDNVRNILCVWCNNKRG